MSFENISEKERSGAATLIAEAKNEGASLPPAMILLVDFEKSKGRDLDAGGAELAVARMMRNDFGAEDYVEAAQLAASDLAVQRNAREVFDAGERYKETGVMPGPDEGLKDVYLKYVLPDIAEDQESFSDWEAMAQGRFHDVSDMSDHIPLEETKGYEFLPSEDRDAIWNKAIENDREAEFGSGRRHDEIEDPLEMLEPVRSKGLSDLDNEDFSAGMSRSSMER